MVKTNRYQIHNKTQQSTTHVQITWNSANMTMPHINPIATKLPFSSAFIWGYASHHYYQVLRHIHGDKVNSHGICWIHAWFNNDHNQVLVYVSHLVPCKCGLFKVVRDLTPNYLYDIVTKACDIHDRDTCLSRFKDVHIPLHDSGNC